MARFRKLLLRMEATGFDFLDLETMEVGVKNRRSYGRLAGTIPVIENEVIS